jgi:hypothetical protein
MNQQEWQKSFSAISTPRYRKNSKYTLLANSKIVECPHHTSSYLDIEHKKKYEVSQNHCTRSARCHLDNPHNINIDLPHSGVFVSQPDHGVWFMKVVEHLQKYCGSKVLLTGRMGGFLCGKIPSYQTIDICVPHVNRLSFHFQ